MKKIIYLVLICLTCFFSRVALAVGQKEVLYSNEASIGDWSNPVEIVQFNVISYIYVSAPSIAFDKENNRHIVYVKKEVNPADWSLKSYSLIYVNDISNTPITILKTPQSTSEDMRIIDPSVAVDQNGGVHVVFEQNEPWDSGHTAIMYMYMNLKAIPVILVHGWRGSPVTWSTLRQKIDVEGIDYYIFDYSPATRDPIMYANKLIQWVKELRTDTGYEGKFDIVTHSMGALVSRWYMEELGGSEKIRQWIGIAPVNHGAAIADKYEWLVPDWLGWFFHLSFANTDE